MSTIPASKASSAASWEKSSTSSKSKAGAVSVRRQTLQIARLAPKLLGDSADLVAQFIRGQLNADGGFRNRAGDSDQIGRASCRERVEIWVDAGSLKNKKQR